MAAFAVTVISPPEFIHSAAFNEVAETIHHGLLALGHDSIRTTQTNIAGRQHIILGANLLPKYNMPLADNAILYNLEQMQDNSFWVVPEMLELFKRYTVWDYSHTNVDFLAKVGVQVAKVLPIGYTPSLTRVDPTTPKDIDVLFIGSLNERRIEILHRMQHLGLHIVPLYGVYGAERDAHLARAKVVLNHHFFEAKVLEMVRISYLLANRCTVLSESSSSAEDDLKMAGGIAFGSYDELPHIAVDLVKDEVRRAELAQRGFELIRQRPIESYLSEILV